MCIIARLVHTAPNHLILQKTARLHDRLVGAWVLDSFSKSAGAGFPFAIWTVVCGDDAGNQLLTHLIFAFFVSFLIAGWLVRNGRQISKAYPDDMPQRFHAGDIPRLGGAAVCGGVAVAGLRSVISPTMGDVGATALTFVEWCTWWAVFIPAVGGGCYEDLTHRLSPRWRLSLTLLSGLLAVSLLELAIPRMDWPWFDLAWQTYPILGVGLAVLAVAGLPHALNIIDGYNGLASMVSLIIALALAYVALKVGDWQLAGWMFALAGATGGFLVWNYPRGLLFAGDGGAYFWGVALAVASIRLVQNHDSVSPWFPLLLLIYPVWETLFSIYRKLARGDSPGLADALHFHQLIYRRIVREVFHDDEARRMLMRNNRTSPYLWGFTLLTVIPAVLLWDNTHGLMLFCALFVVTYIPAYLMLVRFKVPKWLRRGRDR